MNKDIKRILEVKKILDEVENLIFVKAFGELEKLEFKEVEALYNGEYPNKDIQSKIFGYLRDLLDDVIDFRKSKK